MVTDLYPSFNPSIEPLVIPCFNRDLVDTGCGCPRGYLEWVKHRDHFSQGDDVHEAFQKE
jgi:hypothetical protein